MPYAIFDYIGAFLRNGFAHVDNITPVIKTIIWPLLSSLQGKTPHQNSPEPSEPCLEPTPTHAGSLRNPPEPRPTRSGTLRNPPEPSKTFRNQPISEPSGTYLWNLRQHTPELSGTFRNPPPEPTPAYAGTLRNLPEPAYAETLRNLPEPASGTYTSTPEPSGTGLRNLHQHTPEPSGTFRNPPPEPTPAHAGTLRNLPELSSGTCSCDPRQHTPELIWAEDPIS